MRKKGEKGQRCLPCEIQEHYKDAPPFNVRRTVENLLLGIPQKYIEGLGAVILCDIASFKENYGVEEKIPSGRYIQTKDEGPPWIEICVDRLILGDEGFFLKIRFIRDLAISNTLYHEVGHHIHRRQGGKSKEAERIAQKWCGKLTRHYYLRKHWHIAIPLLIILSPFVRILRKMCER